MKTLVFTLMFIIDVFCIWYCVNREHYTQQWKTGVVIDKYHLPTKSANDPEDLIFMVKYRSGISREEVEPTIFYSFKIGDQVRFYKKVNINGWYELCFVSPILLIFLYFIFLIESSNSGTYWSDMTNAAKKKKANFDI